VAAAVWISFGLVQCAQSYLLALATGRAWTLLGALAAGMPWWFAWLAVTPAIAMLAERFAFAGGRFWPSLAAHAAAAVAIACAVLLVTGSVYWLTTGQNAGPATSLGNQVQRFFGSFFLESVVTYAGTAGVLISIDFARAIRDEAVVRAQLEARSSALEASAHKARLDALAMELNPHFLFNTLSAISGLVAQDRRAEAREVIQRLGGLLRQTLGTGNGACNSVAREMELLEDYLFIQRTRFSDRLRVSLDVDPAARDCLVPTMLIQPLVENAIRHGLEPSEGQGTVRVRVEVVSSTLRVSIADSGIGFRLDAGGRPVREGIGIANTRARLEHLFGDQAALVLQNAAQGGAEAVVLLPATRDVSLRNASSRNGSAA
jgi:signal transduction histidine kinase